MGKIGRNEPCPCGSGIKYKKCCLRKTEENTTAATRQKVRQVSLREEIGKVQQAAEEGREMLRTIGVFIFFSTAKGDAWLLEVSEMDAVKLAAGKEKFEVDLEENPETIEVEWSHVFEIKDNKFTVTSYKNKEVESYENYPVDKIKKAIREIKRAFSADQLGKVHIQEQQKDIA